MGISPSVSLLHPQRKGLIQYKLGVSLLLKQAEARANSTKELLHNVFVLALLEIPWSQTYLCNCSITSFLVETNCLVEINAVRLGEKTQSTVLNKNRSEMVKTEVVSLHIFVGQQFH